ncbi:hypothetical protein LTR86_007924 [Recurvomyces mirabilis]|nr:hypothetical protein LTR86_007924 [Recurvomyces mirabilis]
MAANSLELVQLAKLEAEVSTDGLTTRHIYQSPPIWGSGSVKKEVVWKRVSSIGSGGFGTVYREEAMTSEDTRGSFGWYETPSTILIAMEFVVHGDLHQYLGLPMPESEAQQIITQTLQALHFMHDLGYAHRDLKPQNLLVFNKAPRWHIKLADFGLSKRIVAEATSLRTSAGTPAFQAPEVLGFGSDDEDLSDDDEAQRSYTKGVDIWAVGVIAFLLLTGETPFPPSEPRVLKRYTKGKIAFPTQRLRQVSAHGCALIQGLLAPKAGNRPSIAASLNHSWLRGNYDLKDVSTTSQVSAASGRWTIKGDTSSVTHRDTSPRQSFSTHGHATGQAREERTITAREKKLAPEQIASEQEPRPPSRHDIAQDEQALTRLQSPRNGQPLSNEPERVVSLRRKGEYYDATSKISIPDIRTTTTNAEHDEAVQERIMSNGAHRIDRTTKKTSNWAPEKDVTTTKPGIVGGSGVLPPVPDIDKEARAHTNPDSSEPIRPFSRERKQVESLDREDSGYEVSARTAASGVSTIAGGTEHEEASEKRVAGDSDWRKAVLAKHMVDQNQEIESRSRPVGVRRTFDISPRMQDLGNRIRTPNGDISPTTSSPASVPERGHSMDDDGRKHTPRLATMAKRFYKDYRKRSSPKAQLIDSPEAGMLATVNHSHAASVSAAEFSKTPAALDPQLDDEFSGNLAGITDIECYALPSQDSTSKKKVIPLLLDKAKWTHERSSMNGRCAVFTTKSRVSEIVTESCVVDTTTGVIVWPLDDNVYRLHIAALSPDGQRLVLRDENVLSVVQQPIGALIWSTEELRFDDMDSPCCAYSPNGQQVLIPQASAVLFLDAANGKRIKQFRPFKGRQGREIDMCVVCSVESGRFVLGSRHGIFLVCDAKNGQVCQAVDFTATDRLSTVVCSQDGRWMTGVAGTTANVWSTSTGAGLEWLAEMKSSVIRSALSPDGIQVALVRTPSKVEIRDFTTGSLLRSLYLELEEKSAWSKVRLHSIAFSPNGRNLCLLVALPSGLRSRAMTNESWIWSLEARTG